MAAACQFRTYPLDPGRGSECAAGPRFAQDVIANALGISQPAVSKLARRARAMDGLDQRSPREVILERAIGVIDEARMMRELRTWTYEPGRFADAQLAEPESYVPGLRDQIEEAAGQGLLSRDEFELLLAPRAA